MNEAEFLVMVFMTIFGVTFIIYNTWLYTVGLKIHAENEGKETWKDKHG